MNFTILLMSFLYKRCAVSRCMHCMFSVAIRSSMLSNVSLILLLAAGVFSLEWALSDSRPHSHDLLSICRCVFEVQSAATRLDIEGAIDKCESSDEYCARVCIFLNICLVIFMYESLQIAYNGIYAKGCSTTAQKITGVGVPIRITCVQENCNADGSLCCCKGDMCNAPL